MTRTWTTTPKLAGGLYSQTVKCGVIRLPALESSITYILVKAKPSIRHMSAPWCCYVDGRPNLPGVVWFSGEQQKLRPPTETPSGTRPKT